MALYEQVFSGCCVETLCLSARPMTGKFVTQQGQYKKYVDVSAHVLVIQSYLVHPVELTAGLCIELTTGLALSPLTLLVRLQATELHTSVYWRH